MEFIKFSAFAILFFTLHTTIPSTSAIEEALRNKAIESLNIALRAVGESVSGAAGLVKNRELSPVEMQAVQSCLVEDLEIAQTDITNLVNGVKNMKEPYFKKEKQAFINLMNYVVSLEQKCIDDVTKANLKPAYRSKFVYVVNKAVGLSQVAATDIANIV